MLHIIHHSNVRNSSQATKFQKYVVISATNGATAATAAAPEAHRLW